MKPRPRYEIVSDEEEGQQQAPISSASTVAPKGRYEIVNDDSSYYPEKTLHGWPALKRAGGIFAGDVANLPVKAVNAVGKAINAAPSEIMGYEKQLFTDPLRILQNLNMGVGKVEQSVVNAPASMGRYMAHLGLRTPEAAEQPLWEQKRNYIGEMFAPKGESQPGDALIQGIPAAALWANPAGKVARVGGKQLGKVANVITGKPKYDALKKKLGVDAKSLEIADAEKKLEEAKLAHEAALTKHEKTIAPFDKATEQLNQKELAHDVAKESHEEAKNIRQEAKNVATSEVGNASPYSMEHTIGEHKQTLKELNQNVAALSHQMENIEPLPKMEATDIEHLYKVNQASRSARGAEENLNLANEAHENAKQSAAGSEEAIRMRLNPERAHAVETAVGLQKAVQGIEEAASTRYKTLMENVKGNPVKVSSYINQKAVKNASPELESVLEHVPEKGIHNAEDVLTKYKDFRTARHDLITGLKEDPSAASRRARLKAYNDSNAIELKFRNALNKGLGSKSKEFKEINKEYRERVFPLRLNKHVRQAEYGTQPPNMMQAYSARGTGRVGKGQQLVRDIIKNDPELVKNVLGQRPIKELIKPNSVTKEYLDLHPEVKNWVDLHKNTLESVEKTKQNIKLAEKQHTEALANHQEAKKFSDSEKKKALEQATQYDAAVSAREGKKSNLQADMTKHFSTITRLEKEIPKLEKNRSELIAQEKAVKQERDKQMVQHKQLKNAAKNHKLNLSQKVKAERDVKNAAREIEKANARIEKLARDKHKIDKEIKTTHFGIKLASRLSWGLLMKLKNKIF